MEHLLKAFAERFEQRDSKTPPRSGRGLGIGATLSAGNRKSALLLPNWFEDAAEYRLKKALVRRGQGVVVFEVIALLLLVEVVGGVVGVGVRESCVGGGGGLG